MVIDPDSGATTEVARGFGIMAKDSLQKIRDTLIWGSTEDICKIAASSGYEATIESADSIRDIYNSMADKTYLVSCIDRFGTYRMILQPVDSAQELLLTEKGWLDQDREHHPVVIRNGFLGKRVVLRFDREIRASREGDLCDPSRVEGVGRGPPGVCRIRRSGGSPGFETPGEKVSPLNLAKRSLRERRYEATGAYRPCHFLRPMRRTGPRRSRRLYSK